MAKSKNHSPEVEQLREENRNLKSENRHLRKQLARAGKSLHRLADLEELANEEGLKDTPKQISIVPERCLVCKGEMTKVAGKMRLLHHYTCSERTKK